MAEQMDYSGLTNEQLNRMWAEMSLGMGDIGGMEKEAQLALLRGNAYRDRPAKGRDTVGNLTRALQLGLSGYEMGKGLEGYQKASGERKNLQTRQKELMAGMGAKNPSQPMVGPIDVMGSQEPMSVVPQESPDQAAITAALRTFGKPKKMPWEEGNDLEPAMPTY